MSGPTRTSKRNARGADLPYKRPLPKEETSVVPTEPESGLLGSLWKKGLSLLTHKTSTESLPTSVSRAAVQPAPVASTSAQPASNGYSASPPRMEGLRQAVRGSTPHSQLFVAPASPQLHASGLSRSQSMMDYSSINRRRAQSPSVSGFALNSNANLDGSRVFAYPAPPLSATSSIISRGRSRSPLASPFMSTSLAAMQIRSPSPEALHGRSPLGTGLLSTRAGDKRPYSEISPAYNPSSHGASPFRAQSLRSPSPTLSSISSPKRPMTWDPKIGFQAAEEESMEESQTQLAVPENEAERILQALEGMKTPFAGGVPNRSIPRSATLPSLDYQLTSFRHSPNPPMSPAGRRQHIEDHERAEQLRARSPGVKLREKLKEQDVRRTASPRRKHQVEDGESIGKDVAEDEEADQPKRKSRRIKSLSPPPVVRRSPRKHKRTEEVEAEPEKPDKPKGKSKKSSRVRSESVEPRAKKSSKVEEKKASSKKKKNADSEDRNERSIPARTESPSRNMFSARDEDMSSDDGADAPAPPNSTAKIVLPKPASLVPLQPVKAPVHRVDMATQVDPIEIAPERTGTTIVTEEIIEAPRVEEIKSRIESAPKPAFSFAAPTLQVSEPPAASTSSPFSNGSAPAAFSFDTSSTRANTAKTEASKPAFSFNIPSSASPLASPAESSKPPNESVKPTFSFSPTPPASTNMPKPTFSFATAAKPSLPPPQPTPNSIAPVEEAVSTQATSPFSFATNTQKDGIATSPFAFKAPASQPAPTFSFSAPTPVAGSSTPTLQPEAASSPTKSPFNFAMSTPAAKTSSGPTPIDESPPATSPAFPSSGPFSPVIAPSSGPAETPRATFAFGSAPAETPSRPAFSFGNATPAVTAAPAFSFGAPASNALGSQPATSSPGFSFGTPSTMEPKAAAPSFSFGSAPPAFGISNPAPSAFSFGSSQSTAAPATSFSFGQPAAISSGFGTPSAAPSTGFGQTNGFSSAPMSITTSAPGSTSFSFGANPSPAPTPGFGQPQAGAFQFAPASSVAAQGAFAFGGPASQPSSAPGTPTGQPGGFTFNMGAGGTEAPKSPGGRKIRRLPTRRG